MGKAQSAMEYLVTYGWAILIIAIVVSLLYLYVIVPSTVVPSTCSFVSGAYCNDVIVGTNLQTHATKLAIFLTNTQEYPLSNPMLIVRTANMNSSSYACSPSFVLAGGSVVCSATLPVQTTLSQFLAGGFYLTGTYCGLSSNYSITKKCTGNVQTYSGSFTSHVQPLINTNNIVLFAAQNATNPANNARDPLRATVLLLGYPLRGATVNFTENVPYYNLQPSLTTTNSTGGAISYIWGTHVGSVAVNAVYAGITNTVSITFTPPTVISFSVSGFAYCGQDSATLVVIDGTPYTCAQWTSTPLACGSGSLHTYNFSDTVSISSYIREIFNKVIVNGVTSTTNHSTITCPSSNESVIANYTTQFYLTETSSPSGGASTLNPGSNWYNNGSTQTLSESANTGYFFNTWSCTGTGCYSGSLTSTTLPINAVISETADYQTTTSTSTTSTSTTSTTSTTSSTSTTSTTSTTSSTSTTSTSTTSTTSSTIPLPTLDGYNTTGWNSCGGEYVDSDVGWIITTCSGPQQGGNNQNNCLEDTTCPLEVSLTTTQANDLIVVIADSQAGIGGAGDSDGLTWHSRPGDFGNGYIDEEWAIASHPLTNDQISDAGACAGCGDGQYAEEVYAVHNINLTSPWDSSSAIPYINNTNGGNVIYTTSSAPDFLVYFGSTPASSSGFTTESSVLGFGYKVVSTTQSKLVVPPVNPGRDGGNNNGDAATNGNG